VEGILHPIRSVKHGAYWRLLLPGLHNLTVTASGYLPQTIFNINVTNENLTSVCFFFLLIRSFVLSGRVSLYLIYRSLVDGELEFAVISKPDTSISL
jgi:hypothetical protein